MICCKVSMCSREGTRLLIGKWVRVHSIGGDFCQKKVYGIFFIQWYVFAQEKFKPKKHYFVPTMIPPYTYHETTCHVTKIMCYIGIFVNSIRTWLTKGLTLKQQMGFPYLSNPANLTQPNIKLTHWVDPSNLIW